MKDRIVSIKKSLVYMIEDLLPGFGESHLVLARNVTLEKYVITNHSSMTMVLQAGKWNSEG